MPELPEVEVVRRGLEKVLVEKPRITKIELMRPDLRDPIPLDLLKTLQGQVVTQVERRAKYLLFRTSKGSILSHLGMTGTWRIAKAGEELLHDHVYLHFSNKIRLAYRDPRRFGVLDFVKSGFESPRLEHLGVEPLTSDWNAEYLLDQMSRKNVSIKVALMDQKIVVGIGNIYASETLFAAQVSPLRAACKVRLDEARLIVKHSQSILKKSIQKGGSSISDFAHTNGQSGYFQNTFNVYARDGEACKVCQKPILSRVFGGRNTFWCPHCQK